MAYNKGMCHYRKNWSYKKFMMYCATLTSDISEHCLWCVESLAACLTAGLPLNLNLSILSDLWLRTSDPSDHWRHSFSTLPGRYQQSLHNVFSYCSGITKGRQMGSVAPRVQQARGRKTASTKRFSTKKHKTRVRYGLTNWPEVAHRNKLLLFRLPTCVIALQTDCRRHSNIIHSS